jgi:hypothetical protein
MIVQNKRCNHNIKEEYRKYRKKIKKIGKTKKKGRVDALTLSFSLRKVG